MAGNGAGGRGKQLGLRSDWGVFGAHGENCPDCAVSDPPAKPGDPNVDQITVPPGFVDRILSDRHLRSGAGAGSLTGLAVVLGCAAFAVLGLLLAATVLS